MAIADPFATFDPTPYQTAPRLPLQTLAILAGALSKRMPGNSPPYVENAEKELRATTEEAVHAMVARLRETNEVRLAADLGLDNAMDGLIGLVRDRLRGWNRYQKPGLDFLLDDPEHQIEFEAVREKASRAATLLRKLFGDGTLAMLSRPFPEQLQRMTNLLELIDEDGHEEELLELSGEELLPLVRRVHVEYAKMVDRRAGDETAARTDLRVVRFKLQRRIVTYASLVLTMLDESEPETLTVVETALQPMVSMRPATARSADASAEAPTDTEPTPDEIADLAELLADAQAETDAG